MFIEYETSNLKEKQKATEESFKQNTTLRTISSLQGYA